jgi:hypothetical protein
MNAKAQLNLPSPYRQVAWVEAQVPRKDQTDLVTVERFQSPSHGAREVFTLKDQNGVREITAPEYARLVKTTL